jgi:outer membrane protein insertion porin family
LAGELPIPEAELKALVTLKPGDVFSAKSSTNPPRKSATAWATTATPSPTSMPRRKSTRKSARQLHLPGGSGPKGLRPPFQRHRQHPTKDEVVRREMRQMEGGWYAADKINRSRVRVERLGYFKETNIETPPVPGTTDQVDVNVNVTEQPTGNILLGAGFSSSDGLILSGSVSQNNLFGSGNRLAVQINSGSVNTVYSLSFTNPYFTKDGISLGYDLYKRDVDTSSLDSVADYSTSTTGIGLRLGRTDHRNGHGQFRPGL